MVRTRRMAGDEPISEEIVEVEVTGTTHGHTQLVGTSGSKDGVNKKKSPRKLCKGNTEGTGKRKKLKKNDRVPVLDHDDDDDDDEEEACMESLQTRMSLSQVVKVNKKLTPEQREAVKEIGFGSLLDLDCLSLRKGLCKWLVDNFDVEKCTMVVHNSEIKVSVSTVERSLGLPSHGDPVPTKGDTSSLGNLLSQIQDKKKNIKVVTVKELMEKEGASDNFKRLYCLFIMTVLLAPSTSQVVRHNCLPAIVNVNKIKDYNWSLFTFDRLMHAIQEYKDPNSECESVQGCVVILLHCFLQHFVPAGQIRERHQLYWIAFWNNERVKKTMRSIRRKGGFQSSSSCHLMASNEEDIDASKIINEQRRMAEKASKEQDDMTARLMHFMEARFDALDRRVDSAVEKVVERVQRLEQEMVSLKESHVIPNTSKTSPEACETGGDLNVEPPAGTDGPPSLEPTSMLNSQQEQMNAGVAKTAMDSSSLEAGVEIGQPLRTYRRTYRTRSQAARSQDVIQCSSGLEGDVARTVIDLELAKRLMVDDESDRQLFEFLMSGYKQSDSELVIVNPITFLSHYEMRVLKPRAWLSTQVIDMLCYQLACDVKRSEATCPIWYLPTCVTEFIRKERPSQNDYEKMVTIMEKHGFISDRDQECDIINVPMIEDNHWYFIRIELCGDKVRVWDTMVGNRGNVEKERKIRKFLSHLGIVLKSLALSKKDIADRLKKVAIEWENAVLQPNIYDCGLYTCLYMQGKVVDHAGFDSTKERRKLACQLWRHESNELNPCHKIK